jgi:hypothetical protein
MYQDTYDPRGVDPKDLKFGLVGYNAPINLVGKDQTGPREAGVDVNQRAEQLNTRPRYMTQGRV